MFVSRLYCYFSFIIITFLWSDFSVAQKKTDAFEVAVTTIKKNIKCCSVAFPGNKSNKATTVMIFRTGEMTIVYSNNRPPVSFNLFELYKDVEAPKGIYYKPGTKTIVFNIGEFNKQAIRLNTNSIALETYHQFLSIIQLGKETNARVSK
jgi:hypothetical protein